MRHGVLVVGGAVTGAALGDAFLARGRGAGSRKSHLKAYAPEVYTPDALQQWIETGRRQEAKDRVLLPGVARSFVPGTGAGAWRRRRPNLVGPV